MVMEVVSVNMTSALQCILRLTNNPMRFLLRQMSMTIDYKSTNRMMKVCVIERESLLLTGVLSEKLLSLYLLDRYHFGAEIIL